MKIDIEVVSFYPIFLIFYIIAISYASRGIDESELVTHWEPKSISQETTFQRDLNNWQSIAKNLVEFIQGVVMNMKEEGYRGRTVMVKIRFADFKTYTRAKTLDAFTDSDPEIRRAAFRVPW